MKNIIYKIGKVALACPLLWGVCACDDWFTLTPDTAMVAQDFWKDKKDVEAAMGACYRSMLEGGFMERLIAWGEVRSDNVVPLSPDQNTSDLLNLNIKAANGYTSWGDFYKTINYCNALIQNAPEVQTKDPDFSDADLMSYLAEAKTVRAFCYFMLVRTFGDVPYITEPYLDDTRDYLVAQTDRDEILRLLLEDLKTVEGRAPVLFEDNDPYTKARVTQKTLWTLMADMYLWLNDYDNCITYCDKVLDSNENPLHLVEMNNYFNIVFYNGYSDETLWELPFDANTNNNAVADFYGTSTSSTSRLMTYDLGALFINKQDLRYIGSYFMDSGKGLIYKYVAYRNTTVLSPVNKNDFQVGDSHLRHWILYRLADVYLMKAEALAYKGGAVELDEAVDLVSKTYDRANPSLAAGSLKGQYKSQSEIIDLVLLERQREFLFEGKRYFDLLRRLRRSGDLTDIINNYLANRYKAMTTMQESVYKSKLSDIEAFYLPINQDELKLNTLLKQNRFYMTSSDISKK